MQLSMRSSRLAPLAKCPRDTIIRNWVIWARLGWEGKGLRAGFVSSFALGAALQPWGFLGQNRGGSECKQSSQGTNNLAAPCSGGRLERKGVEIKQLIPGVGLIEDIPLPLGKCTKRTGWLLKRHLPSKQQGEISGLQLGLVLLGLGMLWPAVSISRRGEAEAGLSAVLSA